MVRNLEKWEIAVAKNVVNGFLRRNEIKGYDFDDLLQECLVHWGQNRKKYRSDKEASKATFMGYILRRRLDEILREQLADKRRVNQIVEPMIVVPDQDDLNGDTLDLSNKNQEEKYFSSQHYFGLENDVKDTISKLPSSQKKLCHLIMEGYPMAHISRILHKPRATLYDEIKRIQRIFLDEGLKEYLE
ncbi:MAG: sigma factor [Candidatus Zixiibacteriota bacterium]